MEQLHLAVVREDGRKNRIYMQLCHTVPHIGESIDPPTTKIEILSSVVKNVIHSPSKERLKACGFILDCDYAAMIFI